MAIMAEDTDMVIPDIMAMDMADGGAKDPLMSNPKPMLTQLLMPTMVIMAVDTVTVMDSEVTLVTVWQCSTSTGTGFTLGLSTQCSVVTSRQACFTVAFREWATAWAATGAARAAWW